MVYLAAQQQNKLIQFPVCANVGVLFTLDILSRAWEKHIRFRGGSTIFFKRGCTRLLLYFNTNKPHSFFFFAEYQLY